MVTTKGFVISASGYFLQSVPDLIMHSHQDTEASPLPSSFPLECIPSQGGHTETKEGLTEVCILALFHSNAFLEQTPGTRLVIHVTTHKGGTCSAPPQLF